MPLTHRFSRSTVYVLLVIFIALLGGIGLSIWYTIYTADQNNRKWCGTLRVFHQSYSDNPPQTQTGRDIQRQIEQLYVDFDCASVSRP